MITLRLFKGWEIFLKQVRFFQAESVPNTEITEDRTQLHSSSQMHWRPVETPEKPTLNRIRKLHVQVPCAIWGTCTPMIQMNQARTIAYAYSRMSTMGNTKHTNCEVLVSAGFIPFPTNPPSSAREIFINQHRWDTSMRWKMPASLKYPFSLLPSDSPFFLMCAKEKCCVKLHRNLKGMRHVLFLALLPFSVQG